MEQLVGPTTTPAADRRLWLAGAIVLAGLVAIAAVAVLLSGGREDSTYEAGSPEAAVQAYAGAWAAGDSDAAWQLLTPRAQSRVQQFEFRNAIRWDDDIPSRVWIDERQDFDDHVVLSLSVERTWDGLLGPDRDITSLRLSLVQIDGEWRIDTPIVGFYPW
jgi:hypothetical protein